MKLAPRPREPTDRSRTARMQGRLLALGLAKKPVNEHEERRNGLARLMSRYDRAELDE
jgi:hypothetical protein